MLDTPQPKTPEQAAASVKPTLSVRVVQDDKFQMLGLLQNFYYGEGLSLFVVTAAFDQAKVLEVCKLPLKVYKQLVLTATPSAKEVVYEGPHKLTNFRITGMQGALVVVELTFDGNSGKKDT